MSIRLDLEVFRPQSVEKNSLSELGLLSSSRSGRAVGAAILDPDLGERATGDELGGRGGVEDIGLDIEGTAWCRRLLDLSLRWCRSTGDEGEW